LLSGGNRGIKLYPSFLLFFIVNRFLLKREFLNVSFFIEFILNFIIKIKENLGLHNLSKSSVSFRLYFDSIIRLIDDIRMGEARLLEVDNRLVCPVNQELNILVTSGDVLHCWSVPSLGVKVDAVPGRLNSFPLFILSSGNYYGLCSEICGVNHSFMPIAVEAISIQGFFN